MVPPEQTRRAAGSPIGGQFASTSRPKTTTLSFESDADPARSLPEPIWPPISFESHPWESNAAGISRTEWKATRGPYVAAVVPQIASVHDIQLPGDVRVLAEEAATEIARFDAELGHDIAPFSAVLLRSESAASSKIENLTASARAIAIAELGDRSRPNATLIVSNTKAMRAAIELANRLDSEAVVAMHGALLGDSNREWTGEWRDQQVWIGGRNSPHTARFVPPHHDRVPAAMDDLVAFMARDDLPVVVQAAIAHAQFETIHPFPDGNGRVGRAIIHSLLRGKGLTRTITVPVSAGLLTDTSTYFDALDSYRSGDPVPIVQQLSDASLRSIDNGRHLAADLRSIRQGWTESIRARSDSTAGKLADVLLRQPVVSSSLVQGELGVTVSNSFRAIKRLVEAGVLNEVRGTRRNQLWEAQHVTAALDAFAERAGRRRNT
jgi:Fic family protein